MLEFRSAPAVLAAGTIALVAPLAPAQSSGTALKQQTMRNLLRTVRIDVENAPLEDVVEFIESVTETDLDPLWIDDRNPIGLDPQMLISVKSTRSTGLAVIERILAAVDEAEGGGDRHSWQFTSYGGFEFGPKDRLERRKRTVVYDLSDLIFEFPDFQNAPQFDLNTVFQAGGQAGGGGGGGGQSPFQQQQQQREVTPVNERMEDVVRLIRILAEPDAWAFSGGTAAQAEVWNSQLIVRAPDYVHRALEGYTWWPRGLQSFSVANAERGNRRWVTLGVTTETGIVNKNGVGDATASVGGAVGGP